MIAPSVLQADVLNALRQVGDPRPRQPAPPQRIQDAGKLGLHAVRATTALRTWLRYHAAEFDVDVEKLEIAQRLVRRYGTEIAAALLLAVLPQSYASGLGVGVLGANAELEREPARRIRRTAQFVIDVTTPGPMFSRDELGRNWDPTAGPAADGSFRPWETCEMLRARHDFLRSDLGSRAKTDSVVRALIGTDVPINQEDLLALQLSLSITVFEVLERFGISWTADEQEAYLHLWDAVGAHLGIGSDRAIGELERELKRQGDQKRKADPNTKDVDPPDLDGWVGLRPPSIEQTRRLLTQLRARQWISPAATGPLDQEQWTSARSGRVLTKALLDELAESMPRPLKLMPITLMRALSPDVVRNRLSLGGNGLVVGAIVSLPRSRALTEQFTSMYVYNRAGSRVLRSMGRDIAIRAAMRFLDKGDFIIPGIDQLQSG